MASASLRASAPGSLMLLGEHAVLHGKQALACAVDRRMTVVLHAREDQRIRIESTLGEYESDLGNLTRDNRFRFILAAVEKERAHLASGFDIHVESEFSSEVGLGSSAAVTAATAAALFAWQGKNCSPEDLLAHSTEVVRAVQGMGSGTDAAASIYGGVVAYRMKPLAVRRLNSAPPITLVYSGHKEPTPRVVQLVEETRKSQPRLFNDLFGLIDQSVKEAVEAVESRNWSRLGAILNMNQGLMDAMGVNSPALSDIVFALRSQPGVLGAKISGSGLGDCVVGIGEASLGDSRYTQIPVRISSEGVRVD